MTTGRELIRSILADIPQLPGVYRMLNADKQIIYIGKAKNLKKRLTNYIQPDLTNRISRMIHQTCFLEYSTTGSEAEALLVEAQLIKKFQPRFNILLKDDKSFPYIKLRLEHDYPQAIKYRGKNISEGKLFGPFASSYQLDITLNELQKIFKLRPCSDNYFATRKRPCLQYQIGRCFAPCVGKVSQDDYNELVNQAHDFLLGKTHELQEKLSAKMEELSAALLFEEAAIIRDRIKALSYVQLRSGLQYSGIIDADILAIAEENNTYCIQVFLYRAAQAWGNKAYFPVHTEGSQKSEVFDSFIGQFYQTRTPPKEIITNYPLSQPELIIEALNQLYGAKVKITTYTRGGKAKLIDNAYSNAQLALKQYLKESVKNQAIFAEIKELFSLPEIPERIEVYDNSHIMGSHAVGAMIVATPLGFDKNQYRVFNISAETRTSDDYAMLEEVLFRRLTRLKKEPHNKPSLMIIDGGKGHLSVVKKVMIKLNLEIPFVCMSKGVERNAGREYFHTISREEFTLDKNTPLMKYLQVIRDEVHNFAIKNHRAKRSRAIRISSLDDIANIGEVRKRALLNYFGDFKSIQAATIDELATVQGISKPLATKIYNDLRKNGV